MKEVRVERERASEDDGGPDKAKWLPALGLLRLASPKLSGFPVLELHLSTEYTEQECSFLMGWTHN